MVEPEKKFAVFLGDSGSGKTHAINKLTGFNWLSGPGGSAVTTKTQSKEKEGVTVVDCIGSDMKVSGVPFLEKAYSLAVIFVFVNGRYLDRFQDYEKSLSSYSHLLVPVRAYTVNGKDPKDKISISAQELIDGGLAGIRKHFKKLDTKRPVKAQNRATSNPSTATHLIQVTICPRKHFNFPTKLKNIQISEDDVKKGRALGDALLRVCLIKEGLKCNIPDSHKYIIYNQNSHLCQFLTEKPEEFSKVKEIVFQLYGSKPSEDSIGNVLECMFSWSDPDLCSEKARRVIGSNILASYINWMKEKEQ